MRIDPMPRLLAICSIQRQAAALMPERNELIRIAVERGRSERSVAATLGLSQPRVHEIVTQKK